MKPVHNNIQLKRCTCSVNERGCEVSFRHQCERAWMCLCVDRCIGEHANGIFHVSPYFLFGIAHIRNIQVFMWNNSWWWTIARIDWMLCAGAVPWNVQISSSQKQPYLHSRTLSTQPTCTHRHAHAHTHTWIDLHVYAIITKTTTAGAAHHLWRLSPSKRMHFPHEWYRHNKCISSPHSICDSFVFRLVSYSCKL